MKKICLLLSSLFFSASFFAQNGFIEVDEDARIGLELGSYTLTNTNYSNAHGVYVGNAGGLFDNENSRLNLISTSGLSLVVNEPNGALQAMDISSFGRVGINTLADASSTLHIFEKGSGTTLLLDAELNGSSNVHFAIDGTNFANIRYIDATDLFDFQVFAPSSNSFLTGLQIDNTAHVKIPRILSVGTVNGSYSPAYSGYNNPQGIVIGDAGYIIDDNNAKLNLASLGGFSFLVNEDNTNANEALYINVNGHIGINRPSNVNGKLHIDTGTAGNSIVINDDNQPNTLLRVGDSNRVNVRYIEGGNSGSFDIKMLKNGNIDGIRINDDGHIGLRGAPNSSTVNVVEHDNGLSHGLSITTPTNGEADIAFRSGVTSHASIGYDTSNDQLQIKRQTSGTNLEPIMTFTAGGNVGINVFSGINAKLHIDESSVGNGIVINDGSQPNLALRVNESNKVNFRYLDSSARFDLQVTNGTSLYNRLTILDNGNIGIGTTVPGNYKLAVEGNLGAREVEVKTGSWADHVFEEGYDLKTLEEVKHFINDNGHLPDVPSEEEALSKPHNLGDMDVLLLQKIEELTLYTIEQLEINKVQTEKIKQLEEQIKVLQNKEN